jgi:hypothetical protein
MSHPLCQDRRMRKTQPISQRGRGQVKPGLRQSGIGLDINDFDQLTTASETVEHVTVPGFLRRIPHPWHITDLTRFGDQVGRVAEAMQLSYLTTIQPQLGMIRVFPLPLLQRVYELMAPQFQWPAEPLALLEGARACREELRRAERADTELSTIAEKTDNVSALAAIQEVRDFLKSETTRLRTSLEGGVSAPAAQ